MFGHHGSILRFHHREPLAADELILPPATFDDVRRQVVGVARHRDRLRAAGQHLKRGLLLYGPPGVGKTHTVRYLVGELTGHHDRAAQRRHAARDQAGLLDRAHAPAGDDRGRGRRPDRPAARHVRGRRPCCSCCSTRWTVSTRTPTWSSCSPPTGPTCSRTRWRRGPGGSTRPCTSALPDREARRRLVELYRRGLELDDSPARHVLDRTDGVTASFLKELLRRAAVVAADREGSAASTAAVRRLGRRPRRRPSTTCSTRATG